MARTILLSGAAVAQALRQAGPAGLAPDALEAKFPDASRSTLSRRLKELVEAGAIKSLGRGRAVRYMALTSYGIEEVRRYFETDWQERPSAGFQEQLLLPSPGIDNDMARRLANLHALARVLDKRFLSDFLIELSWASSVLEGSTYSDIDTQVLIEYGERNQDKPIEDAVLILNHKNAIQFMWANREVSTDNLCKLQAFLTDGHKLPEVLESDHFLPDAQRGVAREYEDVRLGRSAYSPPFRPASGYIKQAFERIVQTARTLTPVQSAFYLMTRIPYLQVFANGNKRTARLAANLPLLQAGLLPISFVDFKKSEYVLGMSAFYELGDTQILQKVFLEGYVRSIVRGSDVPPAMRVAGLSSNQLCSALTGYVITAKLPEAGARIFLKDPH